MTDLNESIEREMKKTLDLVKKLNELLNRQQKMLGILVLVCSMMAAVLELLGVSVIIPLIDVLVNPQELLNSKYVSMILSNSRLMTDITEANTDSLVIYVIIGVIVVYLLKNAFFIFNTWLKNKYAFKIQREMSVNMMKKYMNSGYAFFLNHNYSELRQGIDGDVKSLYYIISGILQVVTQILIVAFIGIYMLYKDWQLATGAIITGIVCLILILGIFRNQMIKSGKILRELSIKAEKTMEETLHGIKLVMIYHKENYFVSKYNEEVTKRNREDVIKTAGAEYPMYIIEAISITGIMISLCVKILSLDNPATYVAILGSFAVGMFRILPAIGKISSTVNSIIASMPGLDSVYNNLACYPVIENTIPKTGKVSNDFTDRIEGKNIEFHYENSEKLILDKIEFKIKKGESIGIVGGSGAGKSTLADILLGLLKPTAGELLVDGNDMSYLYSEGWDRIGYVPQTIFLTDSTIAENVAYGIDHENIDINAVRQALAKANILEFVESLPDGLDSMVGDRGVRLSGGQRQRIGIARALYTSPDILILDEATSALDNETEKAVMEAIERLQGEMTLIIIAHRLSTIQNCDRIIEIKDGHIYEHGNEVKGK